MKLASIVFLLSSFVILADPPAKFDKELAGPVADLPLKAVGLVNKSKDKEATAVAVVQAAIARKPAAAVPVVASVVKAAPATAAAVEAAAIKAAPDQKDEIAQAVRRGIGKDKHDKHDEDRGHGVRPHDYASPGHPNKPKKPHPDVPPGPPTNRGKNN